MSGQPFDLSLTEEQRITRESLKRFAADILRAQSRAADEKAEAPEGYYQQTLDLGLGLMPVPEEFGGAGVGRQPISNVLNLEDLAYGDMSLALGAVTPLSFVNVLLDMGSTAQQEAWLPRLCEGFVPATIALMEPRVAFDPAVLNTSARRDGDNYVLNGSKSMVALGVSAEVMIVVAMLEDEGPAAFIVEKGSAGLSAAREDLMGLRPLEMARLTLDDVVVPGHNRLENYNHERLVDLGRIGACALAVGTCEAVLDYVTAYVNERTAFGEPIAYRQSVAFMVANIAIELDAMRMLTWRAVSRAEQGLSFHKEAYLARVLCAEKSMEIGTNGVQLLGGHGFIRDHHVELFYRNLRAVALLEGAAIV